jgi:hypothetical protein
MSFTHLPEEQARRAEDLYESLRAAADADLKAIAELLATKPDNQLFGETEYKIREIVQQIGAEAVQTAVDQRKKRGTKVPV